MLLFHQARHDARCDGQAAIGQRKVLDTQRIAQPPPFAGLPAPGIRPI